MQVYKPLFLDFSPYEQHIFVHDEISLCFLDLVDLSVHKQRKTQVSWVSATDSNGEKKSLLPSSCISRVIRITCLQTTYIPLYHSAVTAHAHRKSRVHSNNTLTRNVYVMLVYVFLIAVALLCCDMLWYSWSGNAGRISTDLLPSILCSHS